MYQLSCDISYWASRNLEEGLQIADALHINNIELTDFAGKPLELCSGDEVEDIRSALIDHNKTIVLLTTAIPVTDEETFNRLFQKAHLLHVQNIRIPLDARAQSPDAPALTTILKMARLWNIGIVFENEHRSFLRDNQSIADFLAPLPEQAGLVFNPAEFAALLHHPFFHVFYASHQKNRIRFLRLNDALFNTGEGRPLAGGNCEIKELISILLSRSFEGYFSIPPYRGYTLQAMQETLAEYRTLLKNM